MKKTAPDKKAATVVKIDAQQIAAVATKAAVEGVSKSFSGTFARQTKILAGIAGQFEDFNSRLTALEARYTIVADGDDDEEKDDEQEAAVAADGTAVPVPKVAAADEGDDADEEDEEDDDDIESEGIDKGSLEDMGPDPDEDEGEPGHQNEDVENRGDKTTVQDKVGKTVSSAVLASLRKQVSQLTKQHAILAQENAKLKKKLSKTSRQVAASAAEVTRRSRPMYPEVQGLLSKAGVDPNIMAASAQKLTVTEVDALIASSLPGIDVTSRMTLKNKFLEMGLMEDGHVMRQVIPRG